MLGTWSLFAHTLNGARASAIAPFASICQASILRPPLLRTRAALLSSASASNFEFVTMSDEQPHQRDQPASPVFATTKLRKAECGSPRMSFYLAGRRLTPLHAYCLCCRY
ncbi:hypothetical protein BD310DRAFT_536182 [Dichomitus squalens]|uniref:Uncharacterized protein n=1 Tax=Dichomitus squalens TaxID=114155 RepID=A0A4Q9PT66_9APHY|nr:hypothetical protein BD310DRAFT_536182 [Dichomitus squalens]